MNWITKILISSVAVVLGAYLLPGVTVDGFMTAIVVAVVLSIFNTILKPILIVLTIPATILTLGLFLFAINAIIILLADWAVDGFEVNGFWWALLLSFIISILNSLMGNSSESNKSKHLE